MYLLYSLLLCSLKDTLITYSYKHAHITIFNIKNTKEPFNSREVCCKDRDVPSDVRGRQAGQSRTVGYARQLRRSL